jgi:hypothetical protein
VTIYSPFLSFNKSLSLFILPTIGSGTLAISSSVISSLSRVADKTFHRALCCIWMLKFTFPKAHSENRLAMVLDKFDVGVGRSRGFAVHGCRVFSAAYTYGTSRCRYILVSIAQLPRFITFSLSSHITSCLPKVLASFVRN